MSYRFPAEFEPHDATWIAWPHHEPDWPGKLAPIPWVYAEIVRVLHQHERVEILCHDEIVKADAERHARRRTACADNVRLHVVPNDRVWLRDSAPTGVIADDGSIVLVNWRFNAWAKYPNYERDAHVGAGRRATSPGSQRIEPRRPDNGERVVLEGGAIETDGAGHAARDRGVSALADSGAQSRPHARRIRDGLSRRARHSPDDLARRRLRRRRHARPRRRHRALHGAGRRSCWRTRRIRPTTRIIGVRSTTTIGSQLAGGDDGALRIVKLPYPRAVEMNGERLPASYANFYIANGVVIVPTFNDRNDRVALNTLAELFPDRQVVGIHAVDLVWGLGTLHCLSQQQPRGKLDARPAR